MAYLRHLPPIERRLHSLLATRSSVAAEGMGEAVKASYEELERLRAQYPDEVEAFLAEQAAEEANRDPEALARLQMKIEELDPI